MSEEQGVAILHQLAKRTTMTNPKLLLAAAALAVASPPAFADEPARLSVPEFDRLLQQLHIKRQPFASIPWKASVTEARKEAARQQKPIFFNVNTGNCLGFV